MSEPRIGINPLARYVSATASQRRVILEDAKFPEPVMVSYYEPALVAIRDSIADGSVDVARLSTNAVQLRKRQTRNERERRQFISNADALDAFKRWAEANCVPGLHITAAPHIQPKLQLAEVDVSVRPDLLFSEIVRGQRSDWTVKLSFGRKKPLDANTGLYIATGVSMHSHLLFQRPDARILDTNCAVLDVFKGVAFRARAAQKQIIKDLVANCEEIRERWPLVRQRRRRDAG